MATALEVMVFYAAWLGGIIGVVALTNRLLAVPAPSLGRIVGLVSLEVFGGALVWLPVLPFLLAWGLLTVLK